MSLEKSGMVVAVEQDKVVSDLSHLQTCSLQDDNQSLLVLFLHQGLWQDGFSRGAVEFLNLFQSFAFPLFQRNLFLFQHVEWFRGRRG